MTSLSLDSGYSPRVCTPFFTCAHILQSLLYFFKRFYLSIFRERGRAGERGRETSIGCLLHLSQPQPRHVPRLGIRPVTFCFAGWCSTNWVAPFRANHSFIHSPSTCLSRVYPRFSLVFSTGSVWKTSHSTLCQVKDMERHYPMAWALLDYF